MASDGKQPVGRARIAELLNTVRNPEGLSCTRASDKKRDANEGVMQKKKVGRGDFIEQMKALMMEKQKATEAVGHSSKGRSIERDPEVKTVIKKLSAVKHTVEDKKEERENESKSQKKREEESEMSAIFKQGGYGEKKILSTNYVKLKTDPKRIVFEYEVRFQPELDNVSYRFRLLYTQFHEEKDMLCYDGGTKLFTPEKITKDIIQFSLKHPNDDTKVTMIITFKNIAKARDCAFLYNTLFNNFSRILRMTRLKNKYYDHRAAIRIPQHKIEIWPGVVTSVDDFDGGIQLRCDINHRILRTETAYDLIAIAITCYPQNFKDHVEKELLGECVSTRYNNNLYRIDDIEWNQTPMSTFDLSNGQSITFFEYYKKQYNIDIRDLKQPLLISRRKNEKGNKSRLICLVPELCNMTGLTDKMRSDFRVMKDIAVYTRVTPAQRAYAFRKFLSNIKSNVEIQEMLHKWGLTIDEEPVKVEGRNLLPERIILGKDLTVTSVNGQWRNCFRDVSVYHSVNLFNWFLLFPEKSTRIASSFSNLLKKIGPGLGIEISEPNVVTLRDDRIDTYINALRKHINQGVQMVICICPTAREDRYSAIKKFCCKEVPVPSQVINTITLSREDRLRTVVQNIALQMNVKLGGASWAIHVPFKNAMICGIDTYHDKVNGMSVGGFVASCSYDYTEWFSKAVLQGPKEEIVTGLIHSFTSALNHYYQKYREYPDRIVVYRDGLSDGQLEVCRDFEVAQFLQAFKNINSGINPKLTFVVVRKKITTKIFQMTGNDAMKVVNPSPGDVVDQTITKKTYYDFFLVSQFVRSSTANPCHYIVIYDNSSMKLDQIQRLTYKFSHLYYNWPGTVRVPAPCYYAHKLAYLVGQNLRTMPDSSLENKLYYL